MNVNGISCNSGGQHSENHWYRRFDLAGQHAASQGFTVSSVEVGVELASSSDGDLPGDVTVWAIDPADPLTVANLELVATVPVNYENAADLTVLSVPIDAVVPPAKHMVLEAAVDAGASGESFFLAADNTSGETAEDYIRAADCGVTEITSWTTVGQPGVAHIVFAKGKANECITAEQALPGLTQKVTKAKKKKAAKKKALKAGQALAAAECAQPPLPAVTRAAPKAQSKAVTSRPSTGYGFSTR